MKTLLLIGGGGHCRSAVDVIESQGVYSIVGIVDNGKIVYDTVFGYPIIGQDSDLSSLISLAEYALVTLGQINSSSIRAGLYKTVKSLNIKFASIVSPYAYVSKHAEISEGASIMHGAIINAGVQIGVNCIVNSMALIEHDALIGEHCHISTGARINGGVIIESGTFIGSGAVLRQGISIGQNSVIGAGCVVLNDVGSNVVMKVPA
jgi:sugar O-acyltransferase (sialic acid O-acetyltransferase NeuD family)